MFVPGVYLHLSHETERLVDSLSRELDTPCGSPLTPETILVQGPGMATWLSMRLARKRGICAHMDYVYPRAFVWRAFSAVLGSESIEEAAVDEDRLFWLILAELPALLEHPSFAAVKRYVRRDAEGLRLFQFAERTAQVFDQYLIYRPALIRIWETGHDDGAEAHPWQPHLWRALRKHIRGHIAALEHRFLSVLRTDSGAAAGAALPERIALFATTSLPPLFLRVIVALARHRALHFYAFELDQQTASSDGLSSALGQQGRDFRAMLLDAVSESEVLLHNDENFTQPPPHQAAQAPPKAPHGSLLAALQGSDAFGLVEQASRSQRRAPRRANPRQLNLFGAAPEGAPPERLESSALQRPRLAPSDRSVQLHACHGAMREVEVLRDQLLALFDQDPTLRAHDVIVMTPDVDAYAPFVEAVFGASAEDRDFIPYRISDRGARSDSPVLESLARIFALVNTRLSAPAVLDLLTLAPIQQRFELDAGHLGLLSQWVSESGVRWGASAQHRQEHGQPATEYNTWQHGLDRLLLGFAWPGQGLTELDQVVPYDEIEGHHAELLGRFAQLIATLFHHLEILRGQHTLPQWRDELGELLEALIVKNRDTEPEHQRVSEALADLCAAAERAHFLGTLDLRGVQQLVERRLDREVPERGFLQNGVTFCAMLPMRTVPFRVVCLLGMNDGAFPRGHATVDFDLVANDPNGPKLGDRDRRRDDRQLFLEALFAARSHLLITYTGQSIRDNAKRPPSVVVSELIDAVACYRDPATTPSNESERLQLITRELTVYHPLQAFSPRYFDGHDSRLFSYRSTFAEAAGLLRARKEDPRPLFPSADALPPLQPETLVALDDLLDFWRAPARSLLRNRLKLSLSEEEAPLADREPLEPSPLERYAVGERALAHVLAGVSVEHGVTLLRSEGRLPPGESGRLYYAERRQFVRGLAQAADKLRGQLPEKHISCLVDLSSNRTLAGTVDQVFGSKRIRLQTANLSGKHLLSLWISHLLLASAVPDLQSFLISRKTNRVSVFSLRFPSQYDSHLLELVKLRDLGLQAPLRFQVDASYEYATERWQNGLSSEEAIQKVAKSYGSRLIVRPADARLLLPEPPFLETATVGPAFEELAERVFRPLLEHGTEEEVL